MQPANQRAEFVELGALLVIQWMAYAAWLVPLTLVLQTHQLARIQPYAFATSAVAAFVTPLFFGAVADRHAAPARVLRWLAVSSAASLLLVCLAIRSGWNPWLVLGLIQVYALCYSPVTSISTAIALAAMRDPWRQFGPIRAMGTLGWMAGCWLVSLLNADGSIRAALSSAALLMGLALFTYLLRNVEPPASTGHLTWHERLGFDALALLRKADHRVIFLTTTLVSIPLAAFYMFTPPHLRELGFNHPSAWMSLGQTTELIAMFTLGALVARWRLKWIVTAGLIFAVLRFVFCAFNAKIWLLAGVALHGCSYTLIFATAQIYVNDRVEPAWRVRAQALLSLLNSGVGNLLGYLGVGWWFAACTRDHITRWPVFWGWVAAAAVAVLVYFLTAYHGKGARPDRGHDSQNR